MLRERYILDQQRRKRMNRAAQTVSWFIHGSPWRIQITGSRSGYRTAAHGKLYSAFITLIF